MHMNADELVAAADVLQENKLEECVIMNPYTILTNSRTM
jgi:hypothetical protein